MQTRLSVGVIGAGVSGLAAAWHLLRRGHSVRVFEADEVPGGLVRSERHQGFLAEFGPASMAPPPPLYSLVADLGLEERRLWMNRSSTVRYVVRRGVPVPVPSDPLSLLTTPLFSAGGKLRLLLEPLRTARPERGEESLGNLVRERLGQEFVDYALDPIVGGIFAGDPDRLSAAHALPRLRSMETRYGSLLRGGLGALRERRTQGGEVQSFSFRNGLAELPLGIAGVLGSRLCFGARVVGVHRLGHRWILKIAEGASSTRAEFDAVICTVPAHVLPEIEFSGATSESFMALGEIRYVPVAVVVQGFLRDDVTHSLDGFGMLVPHVEGFQSLGTLFSSNLFAERAPQGQVLLTTFVGGERNPGLVASPEEAIADTVQADLQTLLGVRGQPVFVRVRRWRQAIPQYEIGYGRYRSLVDEIQKANPGFVLAGNYCSNGVSVADTMTSGYAVADGLLDRPRQDANPETIPSR